MTKPCATWSESFSIPCPQRSTSTSAPASSARWSSVSRSIDFVERLDGLRLLAEPGEDEAEVEPRGRVVGRQSA